MNIVKIDNITTSSISHIFGPWNALGQVLYRACDQSYGIREVHLFYLQASSFDKYQEGKLTHRSL